MSTKKKYDGRKKAVPVLDTQGRAIPDNLEINKDLEEHMDPNETNEYSMTYYRLKKYLKYKIK
jgi:hypothetical protein